jgi:ELWxxDGT repeat protein
MRSISWWKRLWTESRKERSRRARPRVEILEGRVLPSGTPVLLKDANRLGAGSKPLGLVEVGSTVFFTADDGPHGREVWRTDGTPTGTFLLKDINPNGDIDTDLRDSAVLNGILFFGVWDFGRGAQIWKTDGTAAGTTLVKTIRPYPPSYEHPQGFAALNGLVLFWAYDASHGTELWRSDGTPAGTHLLKDIYPGPNGSFSGYQALLNGQLFFTAQDGVHGIQLWRSDGTAAGTRMVTDNLLDPYDLHAVNGRVVFIADDGVHGNELWSSDGTAAGTYLVQDINPGGGSAFRYLGYTGDPDNITVAGDKAFFSATDGAHGYKVWISDGTSAGTYQLANTDLYLDRFNPSPVLSINATFYFVGGGLWKSDGTPPELLGLPTSIPTTRS